MWKWVSNHEGIDPMTYRSEFPEFDAGTMPEIPGGFIDQSWKNDAMPSFFSHVLRLVIWIDFQKPEDREFPEMKRFSVHTANEDGYSEECKLLTDDWQAVLDWLEGYAAQAEPRTEPECDPIAEQRIDAADVDKA